MLRLTIRSWWFRTRSRKQMFNVCQLVDGEPVILSAQSTFDKAVSRLFVFLAMDNDLKPEELTVCDKSGIMLVYHPDIDRYKLTPSAKKSMVN